MIPSFIEIAEQLNLVKGIRMFQYPDGTRWGVVEDGKVVFRVDEQCPTDEFLMYYVRKIYNQIGGLCFTLSLDTLGTR